MTWQVVFKEQSFPVEAETYEIAYNKALEVLSKSVGYIPYSVRVKYLSINPLKS